MADMNTLARVDAELLWWEKSVEYLFIARGVKHNWITIMSPLAGTVETAVGDALFGNAQAVFLVEFKRHQKDYTAEYRKYNGYLVDRGDEAYNVSKGRVEGLPGAAAHLIIFGFLPHKKRNLPRVADLELHVVEYWKAAEKARNFTGFETMGTVTAESFNQYLTALAAERIEQEDGESESTSGSQYVVAIQVTGETVAVKLENYKKLISKLTVTSKLRI